jgi:hypothetical protein
MFFPGGDKKSNLAVETVQAPFQSILVGSVYFKKERTPSPQVKKI